jgi:hypothetical protein
MHTIFALLLLLLLFLLLLLLLLLLLGVDGGGFGGLGKGLKLGCLDLLGLRLGLVGGKISMMILMSQQYF